MRNVNMLKQSVACAFAMLLGGALLHSACDVTGSNCKIKCEDVHNTCSQKCKDEACKTKCTTDLDDCTASCSSVSTAPKPDGG
jgi:hypothetical protein